MSEEPKVCDELPSEPWKHRLAQNLMIAHAAYRYGNRMSTEEQKRETYEPDAFWFAVAELIEGVRSERVRKFYEAITFPEAASPGSDKTSDSAEVKP